MFCVSRSAYAKKVNIAQMRSAAYHCSFMVNFINTKLYEISDIVPCLSRVVSRIEKTKAVRDCHLFAVYIYE